MSLDTLDSNDNSNPLNRPLTIVFALPGKEFSSSFLISWTMLFNYCVKHQINPLISSHYDVNNYYIKNKCLGGKNTRGKNQKPFNGDIHYDFIMWIDYDKLFKVEDFVALLSHDADVVSGMYLTNTNTFNTIEKFDNEYFKKHGSYNFLTCEDVIAKREKKEDHLINVDFTGMGWMLIKKGVFEQMEYPWFKPEWSSFNLVDASDNKVEVVEFSNEDVAFLNCLKEKNIKLQVDTRVVVGVETKIVLG